MRRRASGGAGSELVEIIRRGRARPTLDHRPEGQILVYDENGLPTLLFTGTDFTRTDIPAAR